MTPANDNLEPLELRICHLDDFPDHVFIAMNRPSAIYGGDQNEALEIARDIWPDVRELMFADIQQYRRDNPGRDPIGDDDFQRRLSEKYSGQIQREIDREKRR